MAIIYTYPVKSVPVATDLILISDSEDSKKTKQVTVTSLPFTNNTGTVTSIGIAVPAAFQASAAITTSGTITIGVTGGNVGQFLGYDGTWRTPAGGAANPAGADTQVQYNSGGTAFGASPNLTYSGNVLSLGAAGTATTSHLKVYGGVSGGTGGDGKLTLYCSTGQHGVTIEGPDHTNGSNYTLKLPKVITTQTAYSSNGRILESDASGALQWITTPTGGSVSQVSASGVLGTSSGTPISISPTTGNVVVTSQAYAGTTNVGHVPSGGSSITFLRGDGTWVTPTNTIYGIMNSGNSYAAGLVLAGSADHQDNFLRKDGTWQTVPTAAVTSYTNAGNNRILTSSGTGVINGESSLVYNGSILTLGTNSTLEGSRNNTDNVQTTNGIIELSNTGSAYGYQSNVDSNANSAGAARHIIFRYNGSEIGFIRNATINSVAYSTSASDERKKKNIVNWNEKVLEDFLLIEPKKFNYLNEEDSDDLTKGFIAQQMVDKFPEAYPKDQDTVDQVGYYSFNPSGMTVYLMKAIKELKEEIDTLTERVKTLEG